MSSRQRAIVACLILALCATPFVFWQPDWAKVGRSAEAKATELAVEVQAALSTDTPTPTNTVGPTPSQTAMPTLTRTPTATVTPVPPSATPRPLGQGRGQPRPRGELVNAPGWDVQVIESLRGDAAWELIQDANQFNDPPRDDYEYILIKVAIECTYLDDAAHKIGGGDFDLTGDRMVRYGNASVVEPDPILDAEMYSGGELTGWVAFEVAAGEGNLILIVDELSNHDTDAQRYLAVSEGARLTVDPALVAIEPTHTDTTRSAPAPLGDTITTENWRLAVVDVVRGKAAWQMILAANQFNAAPANGTEYLAIRIRVTDIATDDKDVRINEYAFRVTGSSRMLHKVPSAVNPSPSLEGRLYPGGSLEGWIVQQCDSGETDLVLVFQPRGSDQADVRYLALE